MAYYDFDCPRCGEQNEEFVSVDAWWQDHKRGNVETAETTCSSCNAVVEYVFDPEDHELTVSQTGETGPWV